MSIPERIPPRPRDAIELTLRCLRVLRRPARHAADSAEIVVCVTVHGDRPEVRGSLESIAAQDIDVNRIGVLVLWDHVGHFEPTVPLPTGLRDRTWLLTANCGSAARSRNTALEFIEREIPSCRWVARLDFDDRFAETKSLAAAVEVGDSADANFVLGGNRVLSRAGDLLRLNPATHDLLRLEVLHERVRGMATGTAPNELPSCNLLLAPRARFRYPDTSSAEDHWLVADLLAHHAKSGAVLAAPLLVDYSLDGDVTNGERATGRHRRAREALLRAVDTWASVRELPGRVLGLGQEAIVREDEGVVYKHFYSGVLEDEKAEWLERALAAPNSITPSPTFRRDPHNGTWTASYAWEPTWAMEETDADAVRRFLSGCLHHGLVCGNIKRANFRRRASGDLIYIDIGNWIRPMDVSVFRDSAARLYSIGVLGNSDLELLRRPTDRTQPTIWERLTGFSSFYGEVVSDHVKEHWSTVPLSHNRPTPARDPDVSLLIKACAMDAPVARQQILHIVDQLVGPRDFAERIVAIDPHPGPFLRQHREGSLDDLIRVAEDLRREGIVDRVLTAPRSAHEHQRLNEEWFGLKCAAERARDGVPVAAQLWAFEQVQTRYLLQCDIDVLVGRRDRSHDYLGDMLTACRSQDVVCVAFNIPHAPNSTPRAYDAPPGEFKPEVRCGLLDLHPLRECRPLPNRVVGDRLEDTWYRALHTRQRGSGLRTLRGGDPATFYVHPPNALKSDADGLARVRDLVAQGIVPEAQWDKWDLVSTGPEWRYPSRREPLVVVALGRDTPVEKVQRFSAGLQMQDCQDFGVVVVDDASAGHHTSRLRSALTWLGDRLTVVQHGRRRGRMANLVLAVRDICSEADTMVVIVDLDDALADPGAVRRVNALSERGHDVVLAAPFRPDAPTKVYRPDFAAPRSTYGGDVWIHLRAYKKRLFDLLRDDVLQLDGAWVPHCTDYATMVPITELARNPVYVPEYLYWHERHTPVEGNHATACDQVIRAVLAKSRLLNC